MLILFSAENYRSIAEEQTLSMVASKQYDKERSEERKAVREKKLIRDRLPGLVNVSYLRTAAIYGSNASGKSTLINAMGIMKRMVNRSAELSGRADLPYEPFRFNSDYVEKPTTFFVSFLWGGVRYEYEFSFNGEMIVSESLYSYPKGQPRKIFTRIAGESGPEIEARFKVDKTIASLLNDDCLFLSFVYDHPNFVGYESVKDAGDFFENGLIVITGSLPGRKGYSRTLRVIEGSEGTDYQRSLISKMLHEADVGITGTEVRDQEYPEEMLKIRDALRQTVNRLAQDAGSKAVLDSGKTSSKYVVFTHGVGDGAREFDEYEESLGTRRLFSLSSFIAQAYETDATLIVDELDSSLHPLLALNIISLFQGDGTSEKRAQLVFTAHQVAFLMNDIFDRDQIWFTKKNGNGSTGLYPLSDYSPRKGEAIWRGYLLGRYDAIPAIPDLFGIVPNASDAAEEIKVQ